MNTNELNELNKTTETTELNYNKKIMIACPIANREWITPYYLRSIYQLDYDKKNIDIYWIVANQKSYDKTLDLLKEFKEKYEDEYNSIEIEIYRDNNKKNKDKRTVNIRKNITYPLLKKLRNMILNKCVKSECDFLFSSDSDIILSKDTLKRLVDNMDNEHKVIAGLIYNGYMFKDGKTEFNIDGAYKFPNIMRKYIGNSKGYIHVNNLLTMKPEKNKIGSLIEIDYTGATYMIHKDVCKIARYDDNKTYGEDMGFCVTAQENGYKLYCDISLFQYHCMSQEVLDYFISQGYFDRIEV